MKSSNHDNGPLEANTVALSLRQLSVADWQRFGAQEIAYIRPVLVNGVHAMAIHAADGTPIGGGTGATNGTGISPGPKVNGAARPIVEGRATQG